MEIKPIHNEADHKAALHRLSSYFDNEPEPGTPDGDHFEVLLTLVEAYETVHFPIDLPDPVEAIRFRMEQSGLTAKDLVPAIGQVNRVYEILNGKRQLTLAMIWKLHRLFGIPTDCLVRPPRQSAAA